MESICGDCACEESTCGACCESVTINARVLRVCRCQLLVCDLCGCQEILVHTGDACRFQVGQCVTITYSGAMTMSIPPQVNAECVRPMRNSGNNCGCCC